jgi:hypothetical protein
MTYWSRVSWLSVTRTLPGLDFVKLTGYALRLEFALEM